MKNVSIYIVLMVLRGLVSILGFLSMFIWYVYLFSSVFQFCYLSCKIFKDLIRHLKVQRLLKW